MSSDSTSAEIHRFERRYAAEPGSLVFARLADAYRRAGQLDRGLEVVEEGLAKHPDYLSAHLVHARILRTLERLDAAAGAVERALALDEQNLVALRARAELAMELGDTATAEKCYERILEIEPFDQVVRDALRDIRASIEPGPSAEPDARIEEGAPESEGAMRAATDPSEAWLASLDESPLVLPPPAGAAEYPSRNRDPSRNRSLRPNPNRSLRPNPNRSPSLSQNRSPNPSPSRSLSQSPNPLIS
jgi:tetratricopeptide (TPR) repeat protein